MGNCLSVSPNRLLTDDPDTLSYFRGDFPPGFRCPFLGFRLAASRSEKTARTCFGLMPSGTSKKKEACSCVV